MTPDNIAWTSFTESQTSLDTVQNLDCVAEEVNDKSEYAITLELHFQNALMINRINKAASRRSSVEEFLLIRNEMETMILKVR